MNRIIINRSTEQQSTEQRFTFSFELYITGTRECGKLNATFISYHKPTESVRT